MFRLPHKTFELGGLAGALGYNECDFGKDVTVGACSSSQYLTGSWKNVGAAVCMVSSTLNSMCYGLKEQDVPVDTGPAACPSWVTSASVAAQQGCKYTPPATMPWCPPGTDANTAYVTGCRVDPTLPAPTPTSSYLPIIGIGAAMLVLGALILK